MLYLGTRNHALSQDAQRALNAADGYLYLGLPEYALEEVSSVPVNERSASAVMLARIRILLHLRQWGEAEVASGLGAARHPDEEEFMVQRAFALHQLQKGEKAIEVLLSAPEWIRKTGILHYNLACYEARLGDLSTARDCIRAAIKLNAAMKKNAKSDPDLQNLWN